MRIRKGLSQPLVLLFILANIANATDANLAAHWKFDEGSGPIAYDSAGSHNGTVYGAGWTGDGQVDGALIFDGYNDYVNVGYIDVNDDWTVCFWAKSHVASGSVYYPIGLGTGRKGVIMGGSYPTVEQRISLYDGVRLLCGTTAVQPEIWYHITVVKNKRSYSIYVNDIAEATGTLDDIDLTDFKIGTRPDLFGWFNGTIDDVRLWNRALTPVEIANAPNLIAHWKFDEGSGAIAYDSAGGHNGTIYGAKWTSNGKFGRALVFNGYNSYIRVGNLGTTCDWTVCFWAKSSKNTGSAYYPIGLSDPYNGIVMGGAYRAIRQHIGLFDGTSVLKTETSVQTGVWRHIAVVKNGTTYSIYVDGVCENTHTDGLNAIGLTNFKIGARSGPLGYFSGTIDEVGVWNRAMELGDIKNPESNTINYIRINGISELPSGIARNPSVLNGQTDVAINEVLSWSPGEVVADVNGHRVYFGTDFNDVNQDLISYITLSSPNFNPGVMDFNTIYYWRVDEVNDSNMWEGNVWRFTTHSGSARNPTPADNTKNVPLNVELSWHPGDRAADVNGHDVYVGADSDAVRYGTRLLTGDVDGNGWVNFGDMLVVSNEWLDTSAVSSLAADLDYNDKIDLADFSIVAGQWGGTTTSYKGRQDANSYTSSGHQSGTTYYWRVDEVNDSNVWAGDIWSFTTKNEGALPALANAPTPLVIPTFDGFGQAMHPDIAYFPDKWNGYNYWMAMTPFTYSNNQSEDPSIVVSDNGLTWEVPPGLTNPLIVAPPAGHNADPAIVYNDDANELWVYFMRYWKTPNQVKLALMKSGDGVNWTEPEYLLTWNLSSSDNERSYSIIKQGSDWHYWGQSNDAPHRIYYRYSTDGENWSETTSVTFSLPPSLAPWHLSVIYVPTKSEYWMLFTAPGGAIGSALFFAKSTDMLHWTLYTNEVLVPSGAGWDNGQIYKSTMLYDSDRQTFRIWYSASDTFLKWGTGYIETNY